MPGPPPEGSSDGRAGGCSLNCARRVHTVSPRSLGLPSADDDDSDLPLPLTVNTVLDRCPARERSALGCWREPGPSSGWSPSDEVFRALEGLILQSQNAHLQQARRAARCVLYLVRWSSPPRRLAPACLLSPTSPPRLATSAAYVAVPDVPERRRARLAGPRSPRTRPSRQISCTFPSSARRRDWRVPGGNRSVDGRTQPADSPGRPASAVRPASPSSSTSTRLRPRPLRPRRSSPPCYPRALPSAPPTSPRTHRARRPARLHTRHDLCVRRVCPLERFAGSLVGSGGSGPFVLVFPARLARTRTLDELDGRWAAVLDREQHERRLVHDQSARWRSRRSA